MHSEPRVNEAKQVASIGGETNIKQPVSNPKSTHLHNSYLMDIFYFFYSDSELGIYLLIWFF